MKPAITSEAVVQTLEKLYADAATKHHFPRTKKENSPIDHTDEKAFYKSMSHAYMAVNREFGNLLYALARASRATTVVEFGTSFGISTIYLAAAVKDNGGGKVVSTEFIPEKAEQAKRNLAEAGLAEFVEIRVGDALETLKNNPVQSIDFVMLDGAKSLYFDVFKILEPAMKSGAIIASDNTDSPDLQNFLDYVRFPENGYITSPISTHGGPGGRGHEITVKI